MANISHLFPVPRNITESCEIMIKRFSEGQLFALFRDKKRLPAVRGLIGEGVESRSGEHHDIEGSGCNYIDLKFGELDKSLSTH
jgi:hypothetical protein